jgi:hypothetical protein
MCLSCLSTWPKHHVHRMEKVQTNVDYYLLLFIFIDYYRRQPLLLARLVTNIRRTSCKVQFLFVRINRN